MLQHCRQQGFCKIRATEYRLKDICNSNGLLYLGRSNKKVTAKRAAVILMPVLRKAPNVVRNLMRCNPRHIIYIILVLSLLTPKIKAQKLDFVATNIAQSLLRAGV